MGKYEELHWSTRNLVEGLSPEDARVVRDFISFHARLSPAARQFLTAAQPETFEWLMQLRKEELSELNKGVQLAHSVGTVGRFTKWLVLTMVVTTTAFSTLGGYLKVWMAWFFAK